MLVVLKGADFSGDYIEKIDISALEPAVSNMLSNLTKYPASPLNAYAQALNTFYKGLVTDGIFSKLTLLCIPLMANSVSEVLYDCATNTTESTNALRSNFSLNSKNELYQSSVTGDGVKMGYERSVDATNLTLFGGFTKASGNDVIRLMGASMHQWTFLAITGVNFLVVGTPVYGQVQFGDTQVLTNGGAMVQRVFPGGVFVCTNNSGSVIYKDATSKLTGSVSVSSTNRYQTHIMPLLTQSSSSVIYPGSCGIFGAATGLTSTEVDNLYNRLNQFYNSFNS